MEKSQEIINLIIGILLLNNFGLSSAALIKFYGDTKHEGEFWQRHASPNDGCINLPHGNDELSSIHTDNDCVILYEHENCGGRSLKLYPGLHSHDDLVSHNFNDLATSFRICAENNWAVSPPAQFYFFEDKNHQNFLMDMRGVCGCTNIPDFANDKISSVNTGGNCLRVYEHGNCQGKMEQLEVGMDHSHLGLYGLNDKVSSVNVCTPCNKLVGTIKKFRFLTDIREMLRTRGAKQIEMASASHFVNDANSPIIRQYEAKRTFKETFTFEKINSLNQVTTAGFDINLGVETTAGIPFFGGAKFSAAFKTAYQKEYSEGSSSRGTYTTENNREFTIRENFTVPPCTDYEISSFLQVMENMPIDYELQIDIHGEVDGRRMSYAELAAAVPRELQNGGWYFDGQRNVVFMSKAKGRIVASVGIKSEVRTFGRRIPTCH